MPEIKLKATDNSITLVFSGTKRPQRLRKNLKHEWRIRYSYSYKPVKKARDRKRDSVIYSLEGQCDETFARNLTIAAAKVIDYYFYNPLVAPDSTICSKTKSRCPPAGSEYGYDRVVITTCETEIQAGVPEWRMYRYRLTLEEAVKVWGELNNGNSCSF